jgi:hypothetical protein
MTIEADMSRPYKRFVLPYEPEYTAHRTNRRMERVMQLHKVVRQHIVSPSLVPSAGGEASAADSSSNGPRGYVELHRVGLARKN